MRDIRADLQERRKFIDAEISSAAAHFEKLLKQLESERDAKVAGLKSDLEAVTTLTKIEHRRMGVPAAIQPPVIQPLVVQHSGVPSLPDFLVHRLSEFGPMSSAELLDLAAEEDVLPRSEQPGRAVVAALARSVREERIKRLPDGRFAALPMSQAIAISSGVIDARIVRNGGSKRISPSSEDTQAPCRSTTIARRRMDP
jgi:hypothetical protein